MDILKTKIDLPTKNTLLFVLNSIYDLDLKDTLAKKTLIKKITKLYENEENVLKLIQILSTSSYLKLEKIYNDYIKGEDPVESFLKNKADDLMDCALFYLIETRYTDKSIDYIYVFNNDAFNHLGVLFSDKGKELFKKEKLFEEVVIGITNTYGVLKMDFFVSLVNSYLNESFNEDSLIDRLLTKLSFNQYVNNFTINWKNIGENDVFFTFLEYDDELGRICESQKQLNFSYNIFDLDEIIKRAKSPYDKNTSELINKIKEYNKKISDEEIDRFIDNTIRGNEDYINEIEKLLKDIDEDKKEDMLNVLATWHNDLELYPLCGYSINNLKEDNYIS